MSVDPCANCGGGDLAVHSNSHQVDEFLGVNAVKRCAQNLVVFDVDDELGNALRGTHNLWARHDVDIRNLCKTHIHAVPAGSSVLACVLFTHADGG